jgi:hypothetical protein
VPRQQPAQRGKQQPVVHLETRSTDLTAKHRQLVPKHQDLKLLCPITSSEEDDQLQQPDHDDVQRRRKQRRPPETGSPTLPPNHGRASHPAKFLHPTGYPATVP